MKGLIDACVLVCNLELGVQNAAMMDEWKCAFQ